MESAGLMTFVKRHTGGRKRLAANLPKRHALDLPPGWQTLLSPVISRIFHTCHFARTGNSRGIDENETHTSLQ